MGCYRKPVVAAAAVTPAPCYPFKWVVGLIIVLIVIEFLCGIVTGGCCCGEEVV